MVEVEKKVEGDKKGDSRDSWQSDPALWKKKEATKDDSKDTQESSKSAEQKKKSEIASATERFLHKRIAPELLSDEGRIVVLVVYLLLVITAAYGVS